MTLFLTLEWPCDRRASVGARHLRNPLHPLEGEEVHAKGRCCLVPPPQCTIISNSHHQRAAMPSPELRICRRGGLSTLAASRRSSPKSLGFDTPPSRGAGQSTMATSALSAEA